MLSKFSRGRQLVELALKKVKLDECQVLVTSTATSEILATPLVELTDSLVSPEPDHACNSPIVQSKTCDKRCVICVNAKAHLERAAQARNEYNHLDSITDVSCKVYAADMQKIILLPKMTTKEHFFTSRLVTFYETFACLNPTTEDSDLVIVWHEAVSGRSAPDVASAYLKCIELSACDKIIFWADNCGGQNKHWTLFTSLCVCVNAEWGPREVTIKYLERGHTFLKADSVHGLIGKRMKKESEILTFDDFVDLCGKAEKK
jgi:hypothetical protein